MTRRHHPALVLAATLGAALIVVPLAALLLKADWPAIPAAVVSSDAWPALRLSLITTSITSVICLLLGTPLAWLLANSQARASGLLRAAITVPLVLPPVVGGVALLLAWGRMGVIGPSLTALGVSIPFTPVAVVLAETFVAMPFYVLAVEGALRGLDRRYLEMAATLGSRELRTLRRVVLPMIAPGVASGLALAWARALGEFGATITFAGNFPGRTQTAPLAIYTTLEDNPDAAIGLSVVMLLISIVILAALRGRWLR